jgi:hypothetical protein
MSRISEDISNFAKFAAYAYVYKTSKLEELFISGDWHFDHELTSLLDNGSLGFVMVNDVTKQVVYSLRGTDILYYPDVLHDVKIYFTNNPINDIIYSDILNQIIRRYYQQRKDKYKIYFASHSLGASKQFDLISKKFPDTDEYYLKFIKDIYFYNIGKKPFGTVSGQKLEESLHQERFIFPFMVDRKIKPEDIKPHIRLIRIEGDLVSTGSFYDFSHTIATIYNIPSVYSVYGIPTSIRHSIYEFINEFRNQGAEDLIITSKIENMTSEQLQNQYNELIKIKADSERQIISEKSKAIKDLELIKHEEKIINDINIKLKQIDQLLMSKNQNLKQRLAELDNEIFKSYLQRKETHLDIIKNNPSPKMLKESQDRLKKIEEELSTKPESMLFLPEQRAEYLNLLKILNVPKSHKIVPLSKDYPPKKSLSSLSQRNAELQKYFKSQEQYTGQKVDTPKPDIQLSDPAKNQRLNELKEIIEGNYLDKQEELISIYDLLKDNIKNKKQQEDIADQLDNLGDDYLYRPANLLLDANLKKEYFELTKEQGKQPSREFVKQLPAGESRISSIQDILRGKRGGESSLMGKQLLPMEQDILNSKAQMRKAVKSPQQFRDTNVIRNELNAINEQLKEFNKILFTPQNYNKEYDKEYKQHQKLTYQKFALEDELNKSASYHVEQTVKEIEERRAREQRMKAGINLINNISPTQQEMESISKQFNDKVNQLKAEGREYIIQPHVPQVGNFAPANQYFRPVSDTSIPTTGTYGMQAGIRPISSASTIMSPFPADMSPLPPPIFGAPPPMSFPPIPLVGGINNIGANNNNQNNMGANNIMADSYGRKRFEDIDRISKKRTTKTETVTREGRVGGAPVTETVKTITETARPFDDKIPVKFDKVSKAPIKKTIGKNLPDTKIKAPPEAKEAVIKDTKPKKLKAPKEHPSKTLEAPTEKKNFKRLTAPQKLKVDKEKTESFKVENNNVQ